MIARMNTTETKYTITPKPTLYKGRKYRSRLEARWQYVFDQLGWNAQYEPSEINGRNPDFIIKCSPNTKYPCSYIIVEIKPAIMQTKEYLDRLMWDYFDVNAHILILDEFPFEKTNNGNYIKIGIGWQRDNEGCTDLYDLEMKCVDDFGSSDKAFDGMVNGIIHRKLFLCPRYDYMDWAHLKSIWVQSANETMFLPV
jgi:hypothetical protein